MSSEVIDLLKDVGGYFFGASGIALAVYKTRAARKDKQIEHQNSIDKIEVETSVELRNQIEIIKHDEKLN